MESLTAAEVARLLGVTSQTVTRLARNGTLPSYRLGERRAFEKTAIQEYMETRNLSPAPQDHARKGDATSGPIAISFFSGALGLDVGMERAGIRSRLFCENDVKCRMTIDSNRPDVALIGDINSISASQVLDFAGINEREGVDVMFGGPPCQAFSTAGARRAFDDKRGNVFLRYLDLAASIRPKYLVIENVRGLLSTAYPLKEGGDPIRGGAMRTVLNRLEDMGYGVSFNLYNAANFGAPQIRERVVIIAKRGGGIVDWLTPTHSDDEAWGLPPWKTFAEAVEPSLPACHYIQFPEKRLKYFRLLKEGQYWKNLPRGIQEEAMGKAFRLGGGKTGFYRRLRRNSPSPTLVTSPTMPATDLCHPIEDRPLSVEEYRAIQGFPEDWVIRGSIQDAYRQIGNAVPVALGEAIGRTILADMAGAPLDPKGQFERFPFSRYCNSSNKTWSCSYTK